MLARGSGAIVNVASVAGLSGIGDRAAYNASKHGLIGLTRTLASEWGGRGVRTNAVCPGWVKTEMDEADQAGGYYSDSDIENRVPMGRFARPNEIAEAIAFLADPALSGFVNGMELRVDGGWLADGSWGPATGGAPRAALIYSRAMSKPLLLIAFAAILSAQNNPVLPEETVKVSEHVWAIMGWPNVAIVVGSSATLVVDTGLGPANGTTIARVAAKLAPGNRKLYLTTTHFHPEHASGESGFPAGTILIRDAVQQHEMELHGKEMVDLFAGRSEQQKSLLATATLRPAGHHVRHRSARRPRRGHRAPAVVRGRAHQRRRTYRRRARSHTGIRRRRAE